MRPLLSLALAAGCGVPAAPAPDVGALEQQVADLQAQVAALQASVDALQGLAPLVPLAPYVQVDAESHDVHIVGANLHVENGAGDTAARNGLGNLIVGYDAPFDGVDRTGSHNLVLGDQNAYGGYGGVVASYAAGIFGRNAVVLGGVEGWADADGASVLGGAGGWASGVNAAVLGGVSGGADGEASTVVGGTSNVASARRAVVVGGVGNTAGQDDATVVAAP